MMEFVEFVITLLLWQHLDTCDSTTCGWKNNNFVIDSDFNDVYVDEGVLESYTDIRTTIICQNRCLSNVECVSFFSNRFNGSCKLVGVKFFNEFVKSTQHIHDTGSRYYNLQDPGKQCTDYIWDIVDNKCYYIVPTVIASFDLAKQACENNGDDLLVTETSSFLERVKRQIKSNLVFNSQSYFMGATDLNTEGVWQWVNGNLVSINNWRPGFPKNQTETADYMLIVKGSNADWLWMDTLNDIQSRRYMCEKLIT